MKPVNVLPFVMLALLKLSFAGTVFPRQEPSTPGFPSGENDEGGEEGGCELTELSKCIVSIATLPLPISACASAMSDLSKMNSTDFNMGNTIAESTDCIVEASNALQELPESCGGCVQAPLGGESKSGEFESFEGEDK